MLGAVLARKDELQVKSLCFSWRQNPSIEVAKNLCHDGAATCATANPENVALGQKCPETGREPKSPPPPFSTRTSFHSFFYRRSERRDRW